MPGQYDQTLLGLADGIDADLVRGQCQYCIWYATCLEHFLGKDGGVQAFSKWAACHKGSQWEPGVLVKGYHS